MDLHLRDRVFLVTGGASGIGEAIVRTLVDEGAIPVVLDLKPKAQSEDLLEVIRGDQSRDPYFEIDLCDEAQIIRAVQEVEENFGRIDGVVNNAGLNDSAGLEQSCEAFEESLRKNLVHCFALVKHSLALLKKSRGNIINIGSKVYETGQGGTSGYAAAKGGVAALTREWALELADDGVRCNTVIPAEVWTPMYEYYISNLSDPDARKKQIEDRIPLGRRMTTPEEIASMVVFLLSDRSSHTTGQIIHVDGGYTHLDRMHGSKK